MRYTQNSHSPAKNNHEIRSTCIQYFEGIRTSNEKIIADIYRKFLPEIKVYICRRNGTEDDARDIFQQALIVIYQKVQANDFTFYKSFGAYLMTICRNIWLKQFRKASRVTNQLPLEIVGDSADRIDSRINEQEKNQLFTRIFQTLPQDAQRLLRLYFEGKKMKEIANIMGYASEGYAKKKKCVYQKKLIDMIQSNPIFLELV